MFREEKVLDEIDHKHFGGRRRKTKKRTRAMQMKKKHFLFCFAGTKSSSGESFAVFKRSGALSLLF